MANILSEPGDDNPIMNTGLHACYILLPAVTGDWGPDTVAGDIIDLPRNGHFMRDIAYLDYEFEWWNGDDIIVGDSCWITSPELSRAIEIANLAGAVFVDSKMSFSENFAAFYSQEKAQYLSGFRRLVPPGMSFYNSKLELLEWNGDDFSIGVRVDYTVRSDTGEYAPAVPPFTLLVTQRAIDLLSDKVRFNIKGCLVEKLHQP